MLVRCSSSASLKLVEAPGPAPGSAVGRFGPGHVDTHLAPIGSPPGLIVALYQQDDADPHCGQHQHDGRA